MFVIITRFAAHTATDIPFDLHGDIAVSLLAYARATLDRTPLPALAILVTTILSATVASTLEAAGVQRSDAGIRHSFLITGATTAIVGENNQIEWQVDRSSRDGFVLPSGNVLVAHAEEVIEYTRQRDIVFRYALSADNKELGTAVRLESGRTLVTELGALPRILEVDAQGAIVASVPLQPETDNTHMQTRMARKRADGSYLVPHLLAFAVKQYDASGAVTHTWKTDLESLGGRPAENWPFTAIELQSGNLLVNLTHGNKSVELDRDGHVVWKLDNTDVAGKLSDPCGAQRLPNGNTVICSYGQPAPDMPKALEVTPDKHVVWEYLDAERRGIHEIQVLTTNGEPVPWPPHK